MRWVQVATGEAAPRLFIAHGLAPRAPPPAYRTPPVSSSSCSWADCCLSVEEVVPRPRQAINETRLGEVREGVVCVPRPPSAPTRAPRADGRIQCRYRPLCSHLDRSDTHQRPPDLLPRTQSQTNRHNAPRTRPESDREERPYIPGPAPQRLTIGTVQSLDLRTALASWSATCLRRWSRRMQRQWTELLVQTPAQHGRPGWHAVWIRPSHYRV